MNRQKNGLIFFAVCAFLVVITTIGIHSDIFVIDTDFYEDKVAMYKSFWYNMEKWWIIVHCMLVLITMWGIRQLKHHRSTLWFGLGFFFYAVFSFTEIARQFLGLFYANNLKIKLELEQVAEAQAHLLAQIDGYSYISYALFGLFIFAFSIGNLFYGIGFLRETEWDKILGLLLLVWGIIGLLTLGNEFWNISWLNRVIEFSSELYQPLVRLAIGWWFVRQIRLQTIPN